MPAIPNVYPVYIFVAGTATQASISVVPATLSIAANARNVSIAFSVVDLTSAGGTANWGFPSSSSSGNGKDEFFGITIQGDDGQQFRVAPRDPSGLFVNVTDQNSNATTYTYTVQLTNGTTTIGIDPTIKNQGG